MREGRPSRTAEQVALARAYATLDPPEDRVCDDPIALSYLGPASRAALLASRLGAVRRAMDLEFRLSAFAASALYVPLRVAFIDRALLRRADAGLDQLVLLGAGFDSRAERFAGSLQGVRIFELDFPATQARKLAMRPAAPNVTYAAVDLAHEPFAPRLIEAGFDPTRRSAFIWEGVIYYLTSDQAAGVLDAIRGLLQPGGTLLLDYMCDAARLGTGAARLLDASLAVLGLAGEPVHLRFAEGEVAPFFEGHGFAVADRAETDELARRHFRGRYVGTKLLPFWGCLELTAK